MRSIHDLSAHLPHAPIPTTRDLTRDDERARQYGKFRGLVVTEVRSEVRPERGRFGWRALRLKH